LLFLVDRERWIDSVLPRGYDPADLRRDHASCKTRKFPGDDGQTGATLGVVVQQFERVLPKSQAEISVLRQRLVRAGYRSDSAVTLFRGAKVVVPLILCALHSLLGPGATVVLCVSRGNWTRISSGLTSGWATGLLPGSRAFGVVFRMCWICWSSALKPV